MSLSEENPHSEPRAGHAPANSPRKRIAIYASALLRESLKPVLVPRGFDCEPADATEDRAPGDVDLVILEMTPELEAQAQTLMSGAPNAAFVLVGLGGNPAVPRSGEVRELSADVSVAEIVSVCQQLAFGTAPPVLARPTRSQASNPFNVLPRPSDPPPARGAAPLGSSPAAGMPSAPPSSRPGVQTLGPPSLPPPMLANIVSRNVSGTPSHELSSDIAELLEQAERRVAQRLRSRMTLPLSVDSERPDALVGLSQEVKAALEEPIGDYDAGHGSGGARSALPPRTRGASVAPASEAVAGPETRNEELPTRTGMPIPEPPSKSAFTASSPPRQSFGAAHESEVNSEPGTRRTPAPLSVRELTAAGNTAAENGIRYDSGRELTLEPMTARPPAAPSAPGPAPSLNPNTSRRDSERLPPAPPLPRDAWVARPAKERLTPVPSARPTDPAQRGEPWPSQASYQDARSRPTTAPAPRPITAAALPQKEIPPLRPGDSVRVLAQAIQSRHSGVVLYEADGGIRRVVLKEGDFVTAASSLPSESLLAFLVERGQLEAEISSQLEHKLPTFGRHAGAALIAGGHLAQDQLWPVLRAHAEFLVGQALQLDHGVAAYESAIPERLMAEPSVFGGATGSEVLIEILCRVLPPEVAVRRLGGPKVRLRYGPQQALQDEAALSQEEQQLLDWTLKLTLGDALAQANSPEFPCVLLGLLELGVLASDSRDSVPVESGADELTPTRFRTEAKDHFDERALRIAIGRRRALVDNGDYFSLLGVPSGATNFDVRRAYLELKRSFDPSVVLTPATTDLGDDVDLIQEVLDEAYEILRDDVRRERYRRAIESKPAN